MTRLWTSPALLLGLFAAGCAQPRHEDGNAKVDEAARPVAKTAARDEAVPPGQVPEVVMKAALAAVPGFTLKSAEKEIENGTTVYSLEGTAGGKECDIEVTADGKVTEVERDGDEDGNDDAARDDDDEKGHADEDEDDDDGDEEDDD